MTTHYLAHMPRDIDIDARLNELYADGPQGVQYAGGVGQYQPILSGQAIPHSYGPGTNNPNIGLGSAQGWSAPTQNTNGTAMGGGSGVNPGGMAAYGGQSNPAQGIFTGNTPAYTPGASAYQYGGAPGGAAAAEAQDQQAGQNALNQQASQANNQYQSQQMADLGNTVGSQQQLANYYQSIANGTGPNLAQAQMNAATDQSIQAQMAMANSARGPLAAAGAQRGAQQAGVGMQQNAAEQSAINTIQQQQMAAQAAAGLYGDIAQQQLGQQNLSNQFAMGNAQLGQAQNQLGQQTALGYAGLGANVAQAQLGAQEQQQQANLQAAGLGQQQSQFQTQQNNQMLGTYLGAASGFVGGMLPDADFADANFQEPGGGAAMTLREERGGPHHDPFLALIDRTTGRVGKVPMAPLTPEEHAQLYAPHGAGPLNSPDRQRTVVHDISMGDGDVAPEHHESRDRDTDMGRNARQRAFDEGVRAATGPAYLSEMSKLHPYLPAQGGQPARVLGPFGYVPARASPPPPNLPSPPVPPGMQVTGVQPATPYGDVDLRHGQYGDYPAVNPGSAIRPEVAPAADPAPPGLTWQQAASVALAPGASLADMYRAFQSMRPDQKQRLGALATATLSPNPGQDVVQQSAGEHPYTPVEPAEPGAGRPDMASLQAMPVPQATPAAAPSPGAGTIPLTAAGGVGPHASWQSRIRPEEQGRIARGELGQNAALEQQEAADQQAARDKASALTMHADTAAEQDRLAAEQEAISHAEIDRLAKAREGATKEAARASESYGYHPSALRRAMGGIAIALGAAGAGLNPHMQNYGLQLVNQSIDRDLERQKQQIESKRGRVSDLDSALAIAYRHTGDMRQAMALAKSNALDEVDKRAASIAAGHEQDSIGANYALARAALQEEKGRQDAAYWQHVVTGGGGGAGGIQDAIKAYHKLVADAPLKPGAVVPDFPSFLKSWTGAGGASLSERPGGNAGKPNPDAAALEALAKEPLHGQDWYDRNAPDFLRSSASLRNEAGLRALGNSLNKAEGARAAPVTTSTSDVIKATYGRGTDEDVKAVQARARALAEAKKISGTSREREEEEP